MEKAPKSKNLIFKFLPKAASAVNFHNFPFSPGRSEKKLDHSSNKLKSHAGKGFSGPIVSIIPADIQAKERHGSFDSQEPTSPKVSCIGQIKQKKRINKAKRIDSRPLQEPKSKEPKRQTSVIRKIFGVAKPGRKIQSEDLADRKASASEIVPSLGEMKRFASGRGSLANFDWTANQVAPVGSGYRDCCSDEERGESGDDGGEEVIIPFSAPILIGGGGIGLEPRKEVNLWKRRTMAPPRPLRLNTVFVPN